MGIRAVIFDWGGTLTPWHTVDGAKAWEVYADAHGSDVERTATALAEAEDAAWTRAREEHTSASLDDLWTAAGVAATTPEHERALAAYQDFWTPHTFTDPYAPSLLTTLRDDGIKVGVLSNTLWPSTVHDEFFRRDGVLHLIDAAVYSSEIPWAKPHPEAFRAAVSAVEVDDPAETVYVGDRLFDDVWGAQQIGMRTIHVPHSEIPSVQIGHTEGTPDATVHRLSEVADVVQGWR